MQWLQLKNELDHYLGNTSYAGKQRKWQQEDERLANKVLRIHTTISLDGWDHLCVLVLS
jgi:hypothetical protein